jgi:hypothetical protein
MGRPLYKDVNGVKVTGSFGDTDDSSVVQSGIRVEFYDTLIRTDGCIVKQRGAKTYVVTQFANIDGLDHPENSANQTTAVLQAAPPTAAGQMRMTGYTDPGNNSSAVYIAKLTKRVATDFAGNRYTWFLSQFEDSAGDIIVLTPV